MRGSSETAWANAPRVLLAILLAGAFALAGCGGDDETSSGGGDGDAAAGKEIKVGLTIIGPKNDRAFAQQHYDGAVRATKEVPGMKLTATLENRESPQQQADAIKTLANAGNDVIVTGSATFAPLIDELAPRYPDIYFITTSAFPKSPHDNVTAIVHDQGQAGYAAGAVLAKLSKSNTLGYVGSLEIPSDIAAEKGLEAGAKTVKPDIKILSDRVGNFNDSAKAKDLAAAEIDQGADELLGFVDAGIVGLYQAANEANKKDLGVVNITTNGCEDQAYPNVVGTITPKYDNIIADALKEYAEGKLKPGAVLLGVDTPEYQDFELCDQYASREEIAKTREDTFKGFADGSIKLPEDASMPQPSYPVRRGKDF